MHRNDIYQNLRYSDEFNVEDWNALIRLKFRKYFSSEESFNDNKELLRIEIINYIQFAPKDEFLQMFDWSFSIFKDCIETDKESSISELAKSFYEVSETDKKWINNVLTQPDTSTFEERDKISYLFKVLDEILEGAFKPRFKLLFKFAIYIQTGAFQNITNLNFGQLVNQFPNAFKSNASLFLKDPIKSISTNQWRNIAAHKTYTIKKDSIEVKYGMTTINTEILDYEQFYKIFSWAQNIYKVIRLSEVLIYLNHTKEIVDCLGGTQDMEVRFESSLLIIIHNLQTVGFKFISTEESGNTFEINLRKKINDNVRDSLIHASQCLDQLSSAVFMDEFSKEKYNRVKVNIVNETNNKIASSSIDVNIAMKKASSEISIDEYMSAIKFETINEPNKG